MDIDFYQMRVAAIDEAAKRNRWVFAATIIASIAIVGTTWNASPFGLYGVVQDMWTHHLAGDDATQELQKALIKEWVESLFVNIPLFGIRFSVNDIWLLGTGTLFILAIWEFFGLRRENHLIGGLLRDANCEDQRTRAFVFYGVCGTQVFATVTDDDAPIRRMEEHAASLRTPGLQPLVQLLHFLPVVVILSGVVADLGTMFWWSAPFRTGHATLLEHARETGGTDRLIHSLVQMGAEDVAALVFAVIIAFLLWRATRFQKGTVELLRQVASRGWGDIVPGPSPVIAPAAAA